jgi:hypothetical protein
MERNKISQNAKVSRLIVQDLYLIKNLKNK